MGDKLVTFKHSLLNPSGIDPMQPQMHTGWVRGFGGGGEGRGAASHNPVCMLQQSSGSLRQQRSTQGD
jgi:hypothetical protein